MKTNSSPAFSRRLVKLLALLALPILLSLACNYAIVPVTDVQDAAATAVAQTLTAAVPAIQPGGSQPVLQLAGAPGAQPTATRSTAANAAPQGAPAGNAAPEPSATPAVALAPAAFAPDVVFDAPAAVSAGDLLLITWSVTNAACGVTLNNDPVNTSGTFSFVAEDRPDNYTLTYTLVAYGELCSNPIVVTEQRQVNVIVTPPQATLTIINNTSGLLDFVYIVPTGSLDWGDNRLPSLILPGEAVTFTLSPGYYDVLAENEMHDAMGTLVNVLITGEYVWDLR